MNEYFKHISDHRILQNLQVLKGPTGRFRFFSEAIEEFTGRGSRNDVLCTLIVMQASTKRPDGWVTVTMDEIAKRIRRCQRTVFRAVTALELMPWFRSAKLHTSQLNAEGFPNMTKSYHIDLVGLTDAIAKNTNGLFAKELHRKLTEILKFANSMFKAAVKACAVTIEKLCQASITTKIRSSYTSNNSNKNNIDKKPSALPFVEAAIGFSTKELTIDREKIQGWMQNGVNWDEVFT